MTKLMIYWGTMSAQRYLKNSINNNVYNCRLLWEQLDRSWSKIEFRADCRQTLLTADRMTLSTDTQRLSECLERPFVGRRLSAATAAVVVVVCWPVSNWPSIGDRRWPVCRRGDVASVHKHNNAPHYELETFTAVRWFDNKTYRYLSTTRSNKNSRPKQSTHLYIKTSPIFVMELLPKGAC